MRKIIEQTKIQIRPRVIRVAMEYRARIRATGLHHAACRAPRTLPRPTIGGNNPGQGWGTAPSELTLYRDETEGRSFLFDGIAGKSGLLVVFFLPFSSSFWPRLHRHPDPAIRTRLRHAACSKQSNALPFATQTSAIETI